MTDNNSRVHPDNPLWVFCCCGCLPPLGALKGLIFFGPAALYTTLAITVTCVLFLPYHAYLICKLTSTTALLGRNIRLLFLLLFPFAVLVWLPLVGVTTFLCSVVGNFFYLAGSVFLVQEPLVTGGIKKCYQFNHKQVKNFWSICSEKVIIFVENFSCIPQGWDGRVFEIPLFNVLLGLILATYGTIVGPILVLPIVTVKFIPLLIRANVEFCKHPPKCHWFLFWIIGWGLLNILSPFAIVFALLWGLFCGIACPLEALGSDSVASGLLEALRLVREFDLITTACIVPDKSSSCIPEVPPSPREEVVRDVAAGDKKRKLLYDCFLHRCRGVAQTSIEQGLVTTDHLLDAEPFVILGVPALALFDLLTEEATKISDDKLTCAEETSQRSALGGNSNGIIAVFWPRLQSIQTRIKNQKLTTTDMEYIRFQLLLGGSALEALTALARQTKDALVDDNPTEKSNRAKLNQLSSELISTSIDLSRLKFMKERFQPEVLIAAVDCQIAGKKA